MLQHTLAKLSRIAPSRTEPRSLSGARTYCTDRDRYRGAGPGAGTTTAVPVPVPGTGSVGGWYCTRRHIPGTAGQVTQCSFVRYM